MHYRQALEHGHQLLAPHISNPDQESLWLLAWVLGDVSPSLIRSQPQTQLTQQQQIRWQQALAQRLQGVSLAYITGEAPFLDEMVQVSPAVLVPRVETEVLVHWILSQHANQPLCVIDVGTGSGVIALCLAKARPRWEMHAVDIDAAALAVAQANAKRLSQTHIQWHHQDGLQQLSGDIIVSNPPYIAADDPHLQHDGVCCEPRHALVSGGDGLDCIRQIIAEAKQCLNSGGWLYLEHGHTQHEQVQSLLQQAGFTDILGQQDQAGTWRHIRGRVGGGDGVTFC